MSVRSHFQVVGLVVLMLRLFVCVNVEKYAKVLYLQSNSSGVCVCMCVGGGVWVGGLFMYMQVCGCIGV